MSGPLQQLQAIAEGQWGLVTTQQAARVAVDNRTLTRLKAAGTLERVAHGVYRLRGSPPVEHLPLKAAWLQFDPAVCAGERLSDPDVAVVSHASAAALYGVGDLRADIHEFTIPKRQQTRRLDVRLHRGRVTAAHQVLLEGLPTTRAGRMVGDLLQANVDPDGVAGIVGAVLTRVFDYPPVVAKALAPHAARFGFRKGDGVALLDYLLSRTTTRDRAEFVRTARQA